MEQSKDGNGRSVLPNKPLNDGRPQTATRSLTANRWADIAKPVTIFPVSAGAPSLRAPALQLDDVLGRARLNAAPASNAAIGLDHVRLLVAVDPSPEPAEERQETLVFGSQRADLKDRVGTRRNARGFGITTTGMEAALAPGAVDRRGKKPRLLLFSDPTHVVWLRHHGPTPFWARPSTKVRSFVRTPAALAISSAVSTDDSDRSSAWLRS
jgi:hypothetical protein